jgi:hypothetical protein
LFYGLTVRGAVFAPLYVAVMLTTVVWLTGTVVTAKLADDAPERTVTLDGGLATPGLLLESATEIPPAGAGPLSVTVPVELWPPVTVVGDKDRDLSAGGVTVSVAVLAGPPLTAEIVTGVELFTAKVVMGKTAVFMPAGTVTLEGTEATEESLDDRSTVMPPAYAGPVSTTVPFTLLPPTTVFIERFRAESAGRTVTETSVLAPLRVAAKVTGVFAPTDLVSIVKIK